MAQRLETRQWVPFPVELVFAFFANPANLPHMFPPMLEARVEDLRLAAPPARPVAEDPALRFRSVAAGVRSEILISFRAFPWAPSRLSWLARIAEFSWNSHFVDEQVRGPFSLFRHRHGIVAEVREGVEGTLVSDEVDFVLPFGLIGRMGEFIARKQLERSFAFRHKRLPEILKVAEEQARRNL